VLEGEVLPLYGGYAICPWNISEAAPVHAPTQEFVFRDFHGEKSPDRIFDPPYDPSAYPFACCEIGGGMQSWYRYGAVVTPGGVEAHALMKLAGGCSLLGYYMFQGGTNPIGKRGFLNEHVAPRVSYDFQAPLGEFGQVRESYRRLKRLHLFYRDFAPQLAPTATVLPAGAASIDPEDTDTLRYAARAAGESGFLFLNNFQDHVRTKDHRNVAVEIALAGGPLRVPKKGGFTLEAGACAVMPFNLDVEGIRLTYATVQPLARLESDGVTHLFFFGRRGIPCEYCFARNTIEAVEAADSAQDVQKIGRASCRERV
jgi:beta-galactosidase